MDAAENLELNATGFSKNKKLITATDIDNSYRNVEKTIEEKVIQFNKKRIKAAVKSARELRRIDLNDSTYTLTKEEIQQIGLSIIKDEQTKEFIEFQRANVNSQKNNYNELRTTINDLNELNEFSAEIEKHQIQTIEDFSPYDKIIKISSKRHELLENMMKSRRESINDYAKKCVSKKLTENDGLSLLLKIREMYSIKTGSDDIELYEKYDMLSNIDFAHQLSDICFKTNQQNVINAFIPKSLNSNPGLVEHQIVSNKFLGVLLSEKFISNNKVSCFDNAYVNNLKNDKIFTTRTIGELLYMITDEDRKYVEKSLKEQIYCVYDGKRPSKEEYHNWNGLQVYDIDLKLWNGSIDFLKKKLHEALGEFHWYLWICKSASGKGLHIYTKVSPPHHVYLDIKDNEYISKYWYNINYLTKLSNIYDSLNRLNNLKNPNISFEDVFENAFVDNSVGRITSGIRLTYDENPLINPNFVDLHVGLGLGQTIDGYYYQETIDKILLKADETRPYNKKMIDHINNNLVVGKIDEYRKRDKEPSIDLSKYVSLGGDISNLTPLPRTSINYMTRYNVCNTLASLFGKDGLELAHVLLDSKVCKNVGEINSFYSCAISNKKEPSKLGLEILKKAGIIKAVAQELVDNTEKGFKADLKFQIEKSISTELMINTIELSTNEYLSDVKDQIIQTLTGDKINIILSPAGSGKTELIKQLAKDGKRVLLVLPYISVIKNKIETDSSITENFDTFYGASNINDLQYGRNAVTTFDKFSRSNYEKLSKMFDYVFIDESHLLFTSSYRIEATSNAVKKLKELFFISSNDPFAAKICLFTGTETGESYFFSSVANIIRVSKKMQEKRMEFLICDDNLDATTRLAAKSAELINEKYKLMIPTNKGELYTEKLIGMIEYLVGRSIKYGYYKRSNNEQELCRMINENNTVGDYDIVFCSNYLSVGVDINDNEKFASIYLGNFSGYEIEQFNARIRKTGIRSIYCIITNKSDGTTNDILLEEPNLVLRITEDDQLFFIDDKSIASAKNEFIATYDPVLQKITTPGFAWLNGKIQFNPDEYDLLSFENKYNECMQHPIKVARELSKYSYEINVSTQFEGLDIKEQEALKKMGIEAAKQEKIRKHNLLVGTFVDLIKSNNYVNEHGLEFNDVLGWIGKNSDKIEEDRELSNDKNEPIFVQLIFDVFATPVKCIVRSREALEKMYKTAKYLSGKYSKTKAIDIIMSYVDDNGILKQKTFQRSISLLKLIDSSEACELAEPLTTIIEKMYDFVDKFENNGDMKISYNTYQTTIETWTNNYIDALGIKINTMYGFKKLQDGIVEMLQDIAVRSKSKNGIRFSYNKMPEQDSSNMLNRRSVDSLVQNMFKITGDIALNNTTANKIKSRHLILQNQNF